MDRPLPSQIGLQVHDAESRGWMKPLLNLPTGSFPSTIFSPMEKPSGPVVKNENQNYHDSNRLPPCWLLQEDHSGPRHVLKTLTTHARNCAATPSYGENVAGYLSSSSRSKKFNSGQTKTARNRSKASFRRGSRENRPQHPHNLTTHIRRRDSDLSPIPRTFKATCDVARLDEMVNHASRRCRRYGVELGDLRHCERQMCEGQERAEADLVDPADGVNTC